MRCFLREVGVWTQSNPVLVYICPTAGAMPMGGLAELKRRKQEKEEAERGSAGVKEDEQSEAPAERKPGELQHVSCLVRR